MKSLAFFSCFLAAARMACGAVIVIRGPVVPAAGGGPTLLLNETFEGPGTVATWTGTWTSTSYSTSPAPLAGSYSGRQTSATYAYHDLGSLYTELYGKLTVRGTVIGANTQGFFLRLMDASGTANNDVAAYIQQGEGSVHQFRRWTSNFGYTSGAGTAQVGATGSAETDTTYYLWWHWKAGAGDGIFVVRYNTTDDYAGSSVVGGASGTTNGNRTDGVQRIGISSNDATLSDWIFDDIQISTSLIE